MIKIAIFSSFLILISASSFASNSIIIEKSEHIAASVKGGGEAG